MCYNNLCLGTGAIVRETKGNRTMRKKGKGLYSSIAIAAAVVLVAVGGAFLFSLSVHRIFKAEITMSLGEIADQSVLTLQREIKGSLQSMRDNAILIG